MREMFPTLEPESGKSGIQLTLAGEGDSFRLSSGLLLGPVGGFVGTVLMDLVMVLIFIAVGASPDLFFSMVGGKLGGGIVH